MGFPMLHKMYILIHESAPPTPSPSLPHSLYFLLVVVPLLADRYKCAQPIGETFPTRPLSLCSCGGKLTSESTMRQGEVIISFPTFLFEYSLRCACNARNQHILIVHTSCWGRQKLFRRRREDCQV